MCIALLCIFTAMIWVLAKAYKLATRQIKLSSSAAIVQSSVDTNSTCPRRGDNDNTFNVNVSIDETDNVDETKKVGRSTRDWRGSDMTVQTRLEENSNGISVNGFVSYDKDDNRDYTNETVDPADDAGGTAVVNKELMNSVNSFAMITAAVVNQTTPEQLRHFFPTTLETISENEDSVD